MKLHLTPVVPLSLLVAVFTFTPMMPANAQDQAATANHSSPPNILVINTEYVKPSNLGNAHAKTEAAIAELLRNGHSADHYFGLESLTGRSRAVFIHGFDSFADWQKSVGADLQNASLASSLDSDSAADGALLDGYMTSVYRFRKDMSLNPGADMATTHFFELTLFRVRSGHEKDWDTVVKQYNDAYAKIPGSHWDMFEKMYGEHSGDTWLLAVPMDSLAYEDVSMGNGGKLKDVVGAEELQKMQDLANATVESVESNLFVINPKMSYAPDRWTKANPKFWGE